ncbi:MAG TPA: hypothetical protein VJM34_15455 [Novosphingobium sp.]|nr:hypothetical protein [Novosphingobium sp.]
MNKEQWLDQSQTAARPEYLGRVERVPSHEFRTLAAMRHLFVFGLVSLSACAGGYPGFKLGGVSAEQYKMDRVHCEGAAIAADTAAEQQAERLESGSDAEIIGAGLVGMFASRAAEKRQYTSCMTALGYRQ